MKKSMNINLYFIMYIFKNVKMIINSIKYTK